MAFNGRYLLNIIHFGVHRGADLTELLRLSGHPEAELGKDSCTVSSGIYDAVVQCAADTTGDALLGLHAGEHLNLTAAGLILQISQTSETVQQALEYCCEFANLGCQSLPMTLREEAHCFSLSFTPEAVWQVQYPQSMRHTAEGAVTFAIREFRSLTRHVHAPIAVHLPWAPAGSPAEYERACGAPVIFNSSEIAIQLRKEHVRDRVITSDYHLLRVLVAHAEAKNAALQSQRGYANRIRESILRLMEPGFPTIEAISGHLDLSPRTLQRRLRAEGVSYSKLIEELRQDFARSYLRRPDLTIGEVAHLLNYADTSAFSRSFKRWTGQSPLEFRHQAQA